MDPKLAHVLSAVNENVHQLQQMNDTAKQVRFNRLHDALAIVHHVHFLSHGMPDHLNPLA